MKNLGQGPHWDEELHRTVRQLTFLGTIEVVRALLLKGHHVFHSAGKHFSACGFVSHHLCLCLYILAIAFSWIIKSITALPKHLCSCSSQFLNFLWHFLQRLLYSVWQRPTLTASENDTWVLLTSHSLAMFSLWCWRLPMRSYFTKFVSCYFRCLQPMSIQEEPRV